MVRRGLHQAAAPSHSALSTDPEISSSAPRLSTPALRALPSVEKLMGHQALAQAASELPRAVVVTAVRETLTEARAALKRSKGGAAPDGETLARAAAARARAASAPVLRRVLNATGIVLHTNLGRAPP